MNYSAAYLVKRSTKQINYFIRHAPTGDGIIVDPFKIIATEDQLKGNSEALSKAESPYIEMLGIFNHKNISIYFSIDEIRRKARGDYLIEHKWLKDPDSVEKWFFQKSIIQTAFIGALASFVSEYKTAKFAIDDGIEKQELTISEKRYSRLIFGNTEYDVKFDTIPVMKFFMTKARCALDFDKAKRFDKAYTRNEWDAYFKNHIKYRKV